MYLNVAHINDIYPLTIISDRYGGTYSGGNYTAWNKFAVQIPEGPDSSDVECADFWRNNKEVVGFGFTPDEAAEDLFMKMRMPNDH